MVRTGTVDGDLRLDSSCVAANIEISPSPRGDESVASTRAKNSPVDGNSPMSERRSATRVKGNSTKGSMKPSMKLLIDEH